MEPGEGSNIPRIILIILKVVNLRETAGTASGGVCGVISLIQRCGSLTKDPTILKMYDFIISRECLSLFLVN